jgi:hypothetical protein
MIPGATTLAELEAIWRGADARLDPAARPAVDAAAARVAAVAAGVPAFPTLSEIWLRLLEADGRPEAGA